MKLKVCALKDNKTMNFFGVSTMQNEAVFIRNVSNVIENDKQSLLHSNTSDFDLYIVGEFDTETGVVEPALSFLCNAGSLVKKDA